MSRLLSGGRLKGTRRNVVRYISSADADARIANGVLKVNIAHVIMLAKQRIIPRHHANRMLRSLLRLENALRPSREFEDIHIQIEQLVSKEIGAEIAGIMHTAKSRNDQVATAIRVVLREELLSLSALLRTLLANLVRTSKRHTQTLFPTYTHLQPAQPSTFAHFLLAHAAALCRNLERIRELYRRVNRSPMGSGAAVGTSFPIDRKLVADLLGFDGLVENSLDATGNRDFILETQGVLSIIAADVCRLCQDIIFLSSSDVGVLELPDEFASTSSIMPQKKNPDVLEVSRARCAKIFANFSATATILHSLPSGYSLDLQEITPLLWESLDTVREALIILTELVPKLKIPRGVENKTVFTFAAATELANTLVREAEVPFREAHRIVGRLVGDLLKKGRSLKTVNLDDLNHAAKAASGRRILLTKAHLAKAIALMECIKATKSFGGPAPTQSSEMIRRMSNVLKKERDLWNHSNLRPRLANIDLKRTTKDIGRS